VNALELRRSLACGQPRCECARGKTHCPAHDDTKPSLAASDGKDGKVLVRCWAGCSQEAVLAALTERGLWKLPRSTNGRQKKVVTEWRVGEYVHVRTDFPDGSKTIIWKQPNGSYGLNGTAVSALPLYGVDTLEEHEGAIVVTEGEKAADSLKKRGVPAVGTVTGANETPCSESLKALLGYSTVVLWPDADDPGRQHMERIAGRLWGLGYRNVRVVEWPSAPAKGDAADFPGDANAVQGLLSAARRYAPTPSIDLASLLDDVCRLTRRYVVINDHQATVTTLFSAHTYAVDAADATPYLSVGSPEKRSGKSRLLEVLELLVARPWLTGRTSPAALYRKVDADNATLLLDESDAAFKSEKEYSEALRGVLNTGWRRGGKTTACIGQGANISTRDFNTFGPKAIAGIGRLPDTIEDRAIKITMKRRAPGEPVERFRRREAAVESLSMREHLEKWAAAATPTLADSRPDIPSELDDRAAEVWEPLLAIADMAGSDWPTRARMAALSLSVGDGREDESLGVRLLADVKVVFAERGVEKIAIKELVNALIAIEEGPWGDLKGKPLNSRGLGWRLRDFGIRARTVRLTDEIIVRGYHRSWFVDAWSRYTPEKTDTPITTDTSNTNDVTVVTDVTVSPGVDAETFRCQRCGATDLAYSRLGNLFCPDCQPELMGVLNA
jgi:hypothetical protein